MNLDDTQKKKVAAWLAEGLKLSEIQKQLAAEFGLQLTYMDVRLLVDDLKLMPKDPELPKPAAPANSQTAAVLGATGPAKTPEPGPKAGGVSVTVDLIAKPGAVVSGQVTFSDGNTAGWYLDEANRLGLIPKQQGYRPSAADAQQFQMALQEELSKY
jgi:hypothetical protein